MTKRAASRRPLPSATFTLCPSGTVLITMVVASFAALSRRPAAALTSRGLSFAAKSFSCCDSSIRISSSRRAATAFETHPVSVAAFTSRGLAFAASSFSCRGSSIRISSSRRAAAAAFQRHPVSNARVRPLKRTTRPWERLHPLYSSKASSTDHSSSTSLRDWRMDSSLTDVYDLPTLAVPADQIHKILRGVAAPYLASHMEDLEGIHPRVKLVRDVPSNIDIRSEDDIRRKLVLLDPSRVLNDSSSEDEQSNENESSQAAELLLSPEQQDISNALLQSFPGIPIDVLVQLSSLNIAAGPTYALSISQEQQTPNRLLQKLLPPEAQPPPTGYEQVGHVLHLNLKAHHEPYGKLIGEVLLEKLQPSIRTVVTKIGEVAGPYRTYDMQVLAGEDSTQVTLVEHGVTLQFDLAKVYWSTRLSGQRTRSIDEEFEPCQTIADAFCGVGALCVRAAVEKECTVLANDLNPDAVRYCIDNARRNGVQDRVAASCGDAHEFIADLGTEGSTLPHHLMLNFPLASTDFLSSIRSWSSDGPLDVEPMVHVYTFARGDSEAVEGQADTTKRDAADVAIDMVANGLLPGYKSSGNDSGNDNIAVINFEQVLNGLGCNVRTREVRDVAPGKVVMWVTFKVTRELLRKMQAD